MEERETFTIEELKMAFIKGYDLANIGVGKEHLIHEWILFNKQLNSDKNVDFEHSDTLSEERIIKWDL